MHQADLLPSASPLDEDAALVALAALSQRTRLKVFRQLVAAAPEGLTPGVLAQQLGLAPSALSFHLRELTEARLVSAEREGRHLLYQANLWTMHRLVAHLTDTCFATTAQPFSLCNHPSVKELQMTEPRILNVLFICTGNSARSIMAESILNQLGAGRFRAYSAGSHPHGQVNPHALEILNRNHYPTTGLRSKNWSEFASPDAPHMDFVLTVCDKAAGEVCPTWPGQPMSAHWGVPDPVAAQGTPEEIERAFMDAFIVLNRRISLFTVLPIDKLDRLALKRELDEIGKR